MDRFSDSMDLKQLALKPSSSTAVFGSSAMHAASRVLRLSKNRPAAKREKEKTGKGTKIRTNKYLWLEAT